MPRVQMAINRYRSIRFLLRAVEELPNMTAQQQEKAVMEADIRAYLHVSATGGVGWVVEVFVR